MIGGHYQIVGPDDGFSDPAQFASDLLDFLRHHAHPCVLEKKKTSGEIGVTVLSNVKIGDYGFCLIRYPINPLESLTKKQKMIVHYVNEGLSNQEIANKLGKSPYTIAVTLGRIFRALNVESRHELNRCGILFSDFQLMAEEKSLK